MNSRLSQISTLWSVVQNANDSQSETVQEAQQQLWDQYSRAARRYLGSALRDDEAVDEVMQELALKIVRQEFKNATPERGSFRTFMKTVLFRMVADYRRRQARGREYTASDKQSDLNPAQEEFASSWREEALEMAWAKLEELEEESGRPWNSVLRVKIDHPEMNSTELAERVTQKTNHEITEANYRVLLHRSREKFAEILVEIVAQTLQVADTTHLQEELAELQLLEFCQSAIAEVAARITPTPES